MKTEIKITHQKMQWIYCYCWFYPFLSSHQQQLFIKLLDRFTHKMKFVGVDVEITEEMKIVVGGWAVLLVLNRPLNINWYQNISSISIYPGKHLRGGNVLGFVADGLYYCQVHLPWQHIRDCSSKATTNGNTILHEFAHVLDHIDRLFNGHPGTLLSENEDQVWRKIFSLDRIRAKSIKNRKQFWRFFKLGRWHKFEPDNAFCIDLAELFAVSTEMFFENPAKLKFFSPKIYHCLTMLYRFNPIVQFSKQQSNF